MELREWLIILGLALVTLIVIDGVRRLQRQRRVPRLDEAGHDAGDETSDPIEDPEAVAREAELNWELPNGGARVVRPAADGGVQPKPKLQRQEHPGPSRVLSEFRRQQGEERPDSFADAPHPASTAAAERPAPSPEAAPAAKSPRPESPAGRPEADLQASDAQARPAARQSEASRDEAGLAEPLVADPADHDGYGDEDDYRLVDLEGMGDSLKSGSKRVGSSVQRFGASLQKTLHERRDHKRQERARREQEKAEQVAREEARRRQQAEEQAAREAERRERQAAEGEDPLFAAPREPAEPTADEMPREDGVVRAHPVLEKALRHDVAAEHARETLGQAEEIIVISVMSRDEDGFSGTALLDLMLACGLRYGRDMGIFHRFETEDPESRLQFSMVNVVKPGTFPIQSMDDFRTPGVTLLMPLPGATDTSAAFEAMVETAMVIVRHLGGELKDEHLSVMTAQTVEFARQRVQEFERRNRLNRYQVN
ncbi:cell division protein ZipA [Halomonas nitroreducens]|uniref:Cell division protein ZipA n=1 Tax=Halomonas nitroreducens TaxID=447425 RepID=A0A3S0HPT2_9GAMM|nr:cell division protein ZipA [Halomonas nitroreducens]RTQ98564.1 cell division protein ZipA [Halomonas nitroreducens]